MHSRIATFALSTMHVSD